MSQSSNNKASFSRDDDHKMMMKLMPWYPFLSLLPNIFLVSMEREGKVHYFVLNFCWFWWVFNALKFMFFFLCHRLILLCLKLFPKKDKCTKIIRKKKREKIYKNFKYFLLSNHNKISLYIKIITLSFPIDF